jgi:hypothetical protein
MNGRLYSGLLVIALLSVQSRAVEYGTDLLNGAGSFEAGPTGPWSCWADGGEVSSIRSSSSVPFTPGNGAYVWGAGPSIASSKNFRASYVNSIPVVPNRKHLVSYRYQIGSSTPSWFEVRINSNASRLGTMYRSNWYGASYIYTTAADETLVKTFELAMYSNGANDAVYIDELTFAQERTLPMVGGDSLQGTLVSGRVNSATFSTIIMPGEDTTKAGIDSSGTPTIAFDQDIVITATNATVSNIQRLGDSEVSADITPSAIGTVNLTFRNQYSDKEYVYTMTSVTPPTACGDAGTVYLAADVNHDCKVSFLDFAVISGQWLQCTDIGVQGCGF